MVKTGGGGGKAEQDKGERKNLPSPSNPRNRATMTVDSVRSVLTPTVVAARPRRCRRWRRCLPAVAAVADGVGTLQVTVTTWIPAAWQYTSCVLRPLARNLSYNSEKSEVETSGCGVKQAGSSTLAHAPPLTTKEFLNTIEWWTWVNSFLWRKLSSNKISMNLWMNK